MTIADAVDSSDALDPRKRRTRVALHRALEELLLRQDFESISVQDIAEAADLNRATFYAHYPDKFALLECMVERRFGELLDKRAVSVDEGCAAALGALTLAVYEYLTLTKSPNGGRRHQLEPHLETAVIAAVRRMLLDGLVHHGPRRTDVSFEILATTASWAIYGTVTEWLRTVKRGKTEQLVSVTQTLVGPILSSPSIAPAPTPRASVSSRAAAQSRPSRR